LEARVDNSVTKNICCRLYFPCSLSAKRSPIVTFYFDSNVFKTGINTLSFFQQRYCLFYYECYHLKISYVYKIFRKENSILNLFIYYFSYSCSITLVHKGFFLTDDGEWMIIRFSAFLQTLHDENTCRFLHRLNFGMVTLLRPFCTRIYVFSELFASS